MGWPIVIDPGAADPIDRPRQPDLTIIAADDTPAAVVALDRDKHLANVHGLDSPTRSDRGKRQLNRFRLVLSRDSPEKHA